MLYVWLASGIVDCCCAFGECSGHYYICRTRHAGLVKQHVCSVQRVAPLFLVSIVIGQCLYLINVLFVVEFEMCTEVFESEEVRVESATTYLVASGFCHNSLSEA